MTVFKELYKKADLDTRNLFKQEKFDTIYAYRDTEFEEKIKTLMAE